MYWELGIVKLFLFAEFLVEFCTLDQMSSLIWHSSAVFSYQKEAAHYWEKYGSTCMCFHLALHLVLKRRPHDTKELRHNWDLKFIKLRVFKSTREKALVSATIFFLNYFNVFTMFLYSCYNGRGNLKKSLATYCTPCTLLKFSHKLAVYKLLCKYSSITSFYH